MWQKCGEGRLSGARMDVAGEIRESVPSNRNCWRAPPERCRNAGEKKDPGCFSSARKGGGGGSSVAEMWQRKAIRRELKFVILARAAGTLRECRRKERPPGCFSSARKGGGVEQDLVLRTQT